MILIIDTHIHLDDDRYDKDIDEVLKRARDIEVKKFIIPGADINDLEKAKILSEKHEDIFFTAGVHPYHAKEFDKKYLKSFLTHPKCIAVGECGLDYYRLPESKDDIKIEKTIQKKVFLEHIELALEYKMPLIVHIRDANQDSFEILKNRDIKGVLHCFNASELLLDLSENFYYGIGGVLTFKNAKKLVEILPKIPKNRLLLETDGPYLTPHPHRGKRNEPSYTQLIAQEMSKILNMSLEEISNLTTKNAKNLFGI